MKIEYPKIITVLKPVYFLLVRLFDFFLFIFLLPVLILLILMIFFRGLFSKKRNAIFAGLEHVIDKTAARGEFLINNNFNCYYYSFEYSKHRSLNILDNNVIKIPFFCTIDFLLFCFLLIRYNPSYIEIYTEGLGLRQIIYSLLGRMNSTLCILILRGMWGLNETRFKLRKIICHACNIVFYREYYMLDILIKEYHLKPQKLYFDHNKTKVYNPISFDRREKIVLFLNGFRSLRRIDIVIKSINIVSKEIPDVKYLLVGARNENEIKYAQNWIDKESVNNFVEIHNWTAKPREFYEKSSVFVFPSDLVFCNFSLLEAMERGLPPVVSNVKDADKIVKHGINGFLCDQNEASLAHYIIQLLKNDDLRKRMGKEARLTIIREFNDSDRMIPILNLINSRYNILK